MPAFLSARHELVGSWRCGGHGLARVGVLSRHAEPNRRPVRLAEGRARADHRDGVRRGPRGHDPRGAARQDQSGEHEQDR